MARDFREPGFTKGSKDPETAGLIADHRIYVDKPDWKSREVIKSQGPLW